MNDYVNVKKNFELNRFFMKNELILLFMIDCMSLTV